MGLNLADIHARFNAGISTVAIDSPTGAEMSVVNHIAIALPIDRPEKVGKKTKATKTTDTKAPKTPKQPKIKSAPVNAPPLNSEFKDMDLPEAIPKVFKKDSGRIFSIDNVIHELYGPIDPSIQAKTRQRIGVSLGHCAIRKVIVRVQSTPSMYQLNA